MYKLLVINLDNDSKRMANLSGRLEEMSIEYEINPAFDGAGIIQDDFINYEVFWFGLFVFSSTWSFI